MVTEDKSLGDTPALIEARATVNLTGLRAGQSALVDPSQPYIAALLQAQRLIEVER